MFSECHHQPNILNVSRLIGPCPRLLLQYSDLSQGDLAAEYTIAARDLVNTQRDILTIIDNFGDMAQSHPPGFHSFFYLTGHATRPERQSKPAMFWPAYRIGTDFLLQTLQWQLYHKHVQNLDDMLDLVKGQRPVFGAFFEAFLLAQTKRGELNNAYQLCERPGAPCHLPRSLCDARSPFTKEHVLSRDGSFPVLDSSQENHLILVEPNFPTVDGVVVTHGEIRLLQLAVSSRHQLLKSGVKRVHEMLEANNTLGQREWHFVFITPSDAAGRQLVESQAAEDLVAYAREELSLRLKMGHMDVERKVSALYSNWGSGGGGGA